MRAIFKYKLDFSVSSDCKVQLPIDHKILSIKNQNELPVLYALVDNNSPSITIKLEIFATGQELPDMWLKDYIDTVMFRDGELVLHFYKDNR